MKYQILQGDNRTTLKTLADNSIDAIVTDPPYGIDFLGKDWDANTGALETYQECLRVLKPGGHILAFSAARTYHHLAITLEQAGFEIRDQIMWIYSSGFPKSQDIGKSIDRAAGKKNELKDRGTNGTKGDKIVKNSPGSGTLCPGCGRDSNARYNCDKGQECGMIYKPQTKEAEQWAGWGTALKPAHEPIALARKPIKLSIAQNCQKWGVGALNIDATRIPMESGDKFDIRVYKENQNNEKRDTELTNIEYGEYEIKQPNDLGRFPSNVLGEIPDYQKYFYYPKVSRKERHIGFDITDIPTNPDGMWDDGVQFQEKKQGVLSRTEMLEIMGGHWADQQGLKIENGDSNMCWTPDTGLIYAHGIRHEYDKWCKNNGKQSGNVGNNHPTVKPVELMKYLIKLITPKGGIVLDPFNGSGSTGCAAVELGYEYIGCELDPAYVEISKKRIEKWLKTADPIRASGLFEIEE